VLTLTVRAQQMGFFVTGAAVMLVILQTSLLLLNREATSWTFTLVTKADQIEPVLTLWNPHLIVLCIACVHCIVTLYYKPWASFSRLYVAGSLFSF